MKHLFYTIAALLLVTTTASAAPFSWDFNGSVNRLLQPQSSVPTEIPVVRSSSTTKASTFANLNNVLYADQFPGADIGVKALAAYASAPDDVEIVFTASSSFAGTMLFNTIGKHVLLRCNPGVVLTYTGTGSSTVFATFQYPDYPTNAGVDGCIFDGPSGSTAVGLSLGNSTGGAAGYKFRNFTVQDFGIGMWFGPNTYLTDTSNFVLQNNNRHLYVAPSDNSGENLRFDDGLLGDCKTLANCAYFATSSSASVLWKGISLDNVQLTIAPGNFNFNVVGGHCENPAAAGAVIGKYACIINSGETTSFDGLSVINMATSSAQTPDAFFVNTGYLTIKSISAWSLNSISAPALVTNSAGATLNVLSCNEIGTAFDIVATSSLGFFSCDNTNVGIGTSSPAGLFDVNGNVFFGSAAGTAVMTLRGGSGRNTVFSQLGSAANSPFTLTSNGALDFQVDGISRINVGEFGDITFGATTTMPTTTISRLTIGNNTGLLKGTSGLVSVATPGTDYVANTTGDWTGTLDGQEGSYYLNAGNLTGTVASARLTGAYTGITSLGSLTTLTVAGTSTFATTTAASSTIGTLNLTNALALAMGGTGATTAAGARTNLGATTVGANIFTLTNPSSSTLLRLNADNTVSAISTSSLNIDLGNTVGTLGATRGGTGLTSFATGDFIYASGANTLSNRTIGTNGQVLQVVGGLPTWVATSSLGIVAGGGGGGGSGTVNTGNTGELAFYTATGTAVSGISSIIASTTSSNRLTITGNSGGGFGYITQVIENTNCAGRASISLATDASPFAGFIAMAGTCTTNTPGDFDLGTNQYGNFNVWTNDLRRLIVSRDGNMMLGTTTENINELFTLQTNNANSAANILAMYDIAGTQRASLTNGGLMQTAGGYLTPFSGEGYAITSGYGTTSSVLADFYAGNSQAIIRGLEGNGIGFHTGSGVQLERMRILQSGPVNVGSTTDNASFAIQGTSTIPTIFNVSSSTGQSIFALIASGAMRLLAITEPAAPVAGTVLTYAKNIAGKIHSFTKNPAGQSMPAQDAMWNSAVIQWRPTNATGGLWVQTVGAGAGTFANTLPSNSTLYTQQKRALYSNVVTTLNQVLGQRNTEAIWWRGDSAGEGGFWACYDWGFTTWTNGSRAFAGLHSGTTVISADPSALNNTVGFAVDAADNGAISFLTRGTSATKAPTGLTIVSGKGYKSCFYAAPNSSEISWWIKDINAGTEVSGTATANLPANNVFLTTGVLASNAALTTVNATQLGVANIYMQADY